VETTDETNCMKNILMVKWKASSLFEDIERRGGCTSNKIMLIYFLDVQCFNSILIVDVNCIFFFLSTAKTCLFGLINRGANHA
jgi:hypothetical protein